MTGITLQHADGSLETLIDCAVCGYQATGEEGGYATTVVDSIEVCESCAESWREMQGEAGHANRRRTSRAPPAPHSPGHGARRPPA